MSEAGAIPTRVQGSWKVRRVSGLLPPGVTKEIAGDCGRTLLFGLHFGSFRIDGPRFVYLRWPIVDVLETSAPDQPVVGRGTIFGLTFCRFRLER
ncbi:MAG TPA: hypothetical protein VHM31_07400 [Polyangia bacterium]|nr:hypothetical protein [Polyangia bacterium]